MKINSGKKIPQKGINNPEYANRFYKIIKGIPVGEGEKPKRKSTNRKYFFPFIEMDDGDCFDVEDTTAKNSAISRARASGISITIRGNRIWKTGTK